MTPLQIEVLFHYYTRVDDWRREDWEQYPALLGTIKGHVEDDLLSHVGFDNEGEAQYQITDRARAYLGAVMALPLPVQKWVMP